MTDVENKVESKFVSTGNKGFQMTFPNGWTVSVQFGTTNYTDVRSYQFEDWNAPMQEENEMWSAETAEIAAWREDFVKEGRVGTDGWYDFGNDKVAGFKTTTEVLQFINKIASL